MNFGDTLNAVSKAPLRTVSECAELLEVCLGRIGNFERGCMECDLGEILEDIASAPDRMREAPLVDAADVVAARESMWRDEDRRAAA